MNQLTPYEFDQTDAGWVALDREGKYQEAAKAIEDYIAHNRQAIANQNEVSLATLFFHAGQEYAMAGLDYYARAVSCMENSRKDSESWNVYVDGTIAFLRNDESTLEVLITELNRLAASDERLKQNTDILKRLRSGIGNRPYAQVYDDVIETAMQGLSLVLPNPAIHAPITLGWFNSEDGHETLLLMGNAENEIESATLESETEILEEFDELRAKGEQYTWMVKFDGTIIGVAWIELVHNHNVKPPSVHLMIGNSEYRGRGIGTAVMQALSEYVHTNLHESTVYSRHLVSNEAVAHMMEKLGFTKDGEPYTDDNNLEWQNITLKS